MKFIVFFLWIMVGHQAFAELGTQDELEELVSRYFKATYRYDSINKHEQNRVMDKVNAKEWSHLDFSSGYLDTLYYVKHSHSIQDGKYAGHIGTVSPDVSHFLPLCSLAKPEKWVQIVLTELREISERTIGFVRENQILYEIIKGLVSCIEDISVSESTFKALLDGLYKFGYKDLSYTNNTSEYGAGLYSFFFLEIAFKLKDERAFNKAVELLNSYDSLSYFSYLLRWKKVKRTLDRTFRLLSLTSYVFKEKDKTVKVIELFDELHSKDSIYNEFGEDLKAYQKVLRGETTVIVNLPQIKFSKEKLSP